MEHYTSLQKQVTGLLTVIEEQKRHAEKLVGIITDTGMVGGYQRIADEERRASRLWKGIAFFTMIGLICFAVWAFNATLERPFDWGPAISKLLVTLAFVFLAGYAGIQVERHQRTERTNRRLELALASVEPFLATLSAEERNEVKKQLAEKLFIQADEHAAPAEHIEAKPVVDMVKAIYDNTIKAK
jgi:hypothetical protein